ncbi:MAG TPA: hypothetical protein DG753_10975 [Clostridium sp.]|nr:hypothetical protein [Clostridium sp.]
MAVKKLPTSISLSIKVQNGVDSKGDAKFSSKSFSGVRAEANPDDVLAVGHAICEILEKETNGCYLSETSLLTNVEA